MHRYEILRSQKSLSDAVERTDTDFAPEWSIANTHAVSNASAAYNDFIRHSETGTLLSVSDNQFTVSRGDGKVLFTIDDFSSIDNRFLTRYFTFTCATEWVKGQFILAGHCVNSSASKANTFGLTIHEGSSLAGEASNTFDSTTDESYACLVIINPHFQRLTNNNGRQSGIAPYTVIKLYSKSQIGKQHSAGTRLETTLRVSSLSARPLKSKTSPGFSTLFVVMTEYAGALDKTLATGSSTDPILSDPSRTIGARFGFEVRIPDDYINYSKASIDYIVDYYNLTTNKPGVASFNTNGTSYVSAGTALRLISSQRHGADFTTAAPSATGFYASNATKKEITARVTNMVQKRLPVIQTPLYNGAKPTGVQFTLSLAMLATDAINSVQSSAAAYTYGLNVPVNNYHAVVLKGMTSNGRPMPIVTVYDNGTNADGASGSFLLTSTGFVSRYIANIRLSSYSFNTITSNILGTNVKSYIVRGKDSANTPVLSGPVSFSIQNTSRYYGANATIGNNYRNKLALKTDFNKATCFYGGEAFTYSTEININTAFGGKAGGHSRSMLGNMFHVVHSNSFIQRADAVLPFTHLYTTGATQLETSTGLTGLPCETHEGVGLVSVTTTSLALVNYHLCRVKHTSNIDVSEEDWFSAFGHDDLGGNGRLDTTSSITGTYGINLFGSPTNTTTGVLWPSLSSTYLYWYVQNLQTHCIDTSRSTNPMFGPFSSGALTTGRSASALSFYDSLTKSFEFIYTINLNSTTPNNNSSIRFIRLNFSANETINSTVIPAHSFNIIPDNVPGMPQAVLLNFQSQAYTRTVRLELEKLYNKAITKGVNGQVITFPEGTTLTVKADSFMLPRIALSPMTSYTSVSFIMDASRYTTTETFPTTLGQSYYVGDNIAYIDNNPVVSVNVPGPYGFSHRINTAVSGSGLNYSYTGNFTDISPASTLSSRKPFTY